jgi:hypothetical protein
MTDTGLKKLEQLKGLTHLYLCACNKVTFPGITELRKAFPTCKISQLTGKMWPPSVE